MNELPKQFGKTPLTRVSNFYKALYKAEFGEEPRVALYAKDGGVFKSLLKERSEVRVAAILIVHFNWCGLEGGNMREFDNLRSHCFPIGWINNNLNQYIAYLRGRNMVTDDELRAWVRQYYKGVVKSSPES